MLRGFQIDQRNGTVHCPLEIRHALAQLDATQREAFLMKHVEDLEYEEMSAMTGVGVSALKMRVKRACDRLRSILTAGQNV